MVPRPASPLSSAAFFLDSPLLSDEHIVDSINVGSVSPYQNGTNLDNGLESQLFLSKLDLTNRSETNSTNLFKDFSNNTLR